MRDAERVESAHRQLKPSSNSKSPSYSKGRPGGADTKALAPELMEIGNVQIRKLNAKYASKKAFAFAAPLKDTERKSAQKAGETEYYHIHRPQTHTIR